MTSRTDPPTLARGNLILRDPRDLATLGPFLKARRQAAGFRSAKEASPHLGVTTRLLVEVERGERTKRGIGLGKLLAVLQQLGYEVELRPRGQLAVGVGETTLPVIVAKGRQRIEREPTRNPAGKQRSARVTSRAGKAAGRGVRA